jgi:four helix bundle protein
MKHDDTRIYRRSMQLVEIARDTQDQLPTGYAFLADQLRRAASSIPLNFAEGCGKSTPRDRRRYFHSARASAYEVAAILDVAQRFGVIDANLHTEGKEACDHIAAMLSNFR